jgi:hypothetical protein
MKKLFASLIASIFITSPASPSAGDMYVRYGDVSLTPNGSPIGEYYVHTTFLILDEATKTVCPYVSVSVNFA